MDLKHFLGCVVNETNATAQDYSGNCSPDTPMHAAPFFGKAENALDATVGINPSPKEFQNGRWPRATLPIDAHLRRLPDYFVNPTVPHYESWFGVWESALKILGKSYFHDTVHLDLSPEGYHTVWRLSG